MRNGRRDGSAIAMGNSGSDGQRWRQWATAGVTMGDSDSRMVGKKEGNGDGGKSNGDGIEGGGRWRW
jgi:hypothetical protein